MNDFLRLVLVVAIGWAITFGLRAFPFLLFAGRNRELPAWVERFGTVISPVIIAFLIIYSYSGLAWRTAWPYLAGVLTVGLQLVFRNGLVSIVSGTILYMALLAFCGGCASRPVVVDIDAEHPELRVSADNVYMGERRIEPNQVAKELANAGVARDRTIHILIGRDANDQVFATALIMILRRDGYSRTVMVTGRESVALSRELRLLADGFYLGSERIDRRNVPAVLERAGFSKEKSIQIYVNDDIPDARPAYALRQELKQCGYQYVDVVKTEYDNQAMFLVTGDGVRYGLLTWVEPEEVADLLRQDKTSSSALIRICGLAKDRNSQTVMKIMLYLEDVVRQAGYRNVKRFWLEDPAMMGVAPARGGRR